MKIMKAWNSDTGILGRAGPAFMGTGRNDAC